MPMMAFGNFVKTREWIGSGSNRVSKVTMTSPGKKIEVSDSIFAKAEKAHLSRGAVREDAHKAAVYRAGSMVDGAARDKAMAAAMDQGGDKKRVSVGPPSKTKE